MFFVVNFPFKKKNRDRRSDMRPATYGVGTVGSRQVKVMACER